jgi:DNA-binding Lrp family transcriptional regulator
MDEFDFGITLLLSKNSRLSPEKIGREIGLSGNAVVNRITKLEKEGIIEGYRTILKPSEFGAATAVHYFENKRKKLVSNLSTLTSLPYVYASLSCITGDVLVITLAGSQKEANEQANQLVELFRELELFRTFYMEEKPSVRLSKRDLKIANYLIKKPKASVSAAAKELSLSTRTVSRRLNRLVQKRVLRFTVNLQLSKISGYVPYYLFFETLLEAQRDTRFAGIALHGAVWSLPLTKTKYVYAICRRNFSQVEEDLKLLESSDWIKEYMVMFPSRFFVNDKPMLSLIEQRMKRFKNT